MKRRAGCQGWETSKGLNSSHLWIKHVLRKIRLCSYHTWHFGTSWEKSSPINRVCCSWTIYRKTSPDVWADCDKAERKERQSERGGQVLSLPVDARCSRKVTFLPPSLKAQTLLEEWSQDLETEVKCKGLSCFSVSSSHTDPSTSLSCLETLNCFSALFVSRGSWSNCQATNSSVQNWKSKTE